MFDNLSNFWKNVLQSIIILIVIGIVVVFLNYLIGNRPIKGSHRIRFEVQASGGFASITMHGGTETIPDLTTVTVPWTKTINIQGGTTVYLTAANPTATGELTCNLYLDGSAWKTETTNAPKNGVACAGIVP